MDIDPDRLADTEVVARRVADKLGAQRRRSRRPPIAARALDGADYAINMIQVGGYKPCT